MIEFVRLHLLFLTNAFMMIGADVVIAGRVADPSLFVGPIAYTFGWDLTRDFPLIAQATLAGHLLGTCIIMHISIHARVPADSCIRLAPMLISVCWRLSVQSSAAYWGKMVLI